MPPTAVLRVTPRARREPDPPGTYPALIPERVLFPDITVALVGRSTNRNYPILMTAFVMGLRGVDKGLIADFKSACYAHVYHLGYDHILNTIREWVTVS